MFFTVGGVLGYKNLQVKNSLDHAIGLDRKGDYQIAEKSLKSTNLSLLLPSVRRKVLQERLNNSRWLLYESYEASAKQFVGAKKYPQAVALLLKIPKDYPTYHEVDTNLKIVLRLQAAAAAKQAAKASKKASSKAVTRRVASIKPPISTTVPFPAGCFAPSSIKGKRFVSTAAFSSISGAVSISQAQQILQTFFNQYSLKIEITSVLPSSYVKNYDTYSLLQKSDLCQLKAFGAIIIDEWSKYPLDWVKNSNVKDIVLVKNLAVGGQRRSATPDIVGHDMYYDATYSGDYIREVIHHEYDHLFTYNYFGSYAPNDPAWKALNPAGFTYGNGGASCYTPGNCATGEHTAPGFVTGYSMSAIEEDKAELYAYLMTSTYYHHLKNWLSIDPYLLNKVKNYKQFIANHSSQMTGTYFDQISP